MLHFGYNSYCFYRLAIVTKQKSKIFKNNAMNSNFTTKADF